VNNGVAVSRTELAGWLVDRVAFYLDRPSEQIDPATELARYGMDSIYAVSVISDIEDRLQVELDLTEARRLGTIDALTDYLLDVTA